MLNKKFNADAILDSTSDESQQQWLQEEIATQNQLLIQSSPLGEEFLKQFEGTGCSEVLDFSGEIEYAGHITEVESGIKLSRIHYAERVLKSRAMLFHARAHEMMHALQYHNNPVMYADVQNYDAPYLLSPSHFVHWQDLVEMNAYAMSFYFSFLLWQSVNQDPEYNVSSLDMRRMRTDADIKTQSMMASLMQMTGGADSNTNVKHLLADDNSERSQRIGEALEGFFIKLYGRIQEQGADQGYVPLKLSQKDILCLGNTFGFNTFGKDSDTLLPIFEELQPLSEKNKEMVEQVKAVFHLESEDDLETLAEALEEDGSDMDSFLKAHRPKGSNDSDFPKLEQF